MCRSYEFVTPKTEEKGSVSVGGFHFVSCLRMNDPDSKRNLIQTLFPEDISSGLRLERTKAKGTAIRDRVIAARLFDCDRVLILSSLFFNVPLHCAIDLLTADSLICRF